MDCIAICRGAYMEWWFGGRCQLWSGRAPATAHTLQLHKLHKLCTIHTTEQNAKWWCCGPRCKPKLGRKQKATQSFDFKTIAFLTSDIILFFSHANHSPPVWFDYIEILLVCAPQSLAWSTRCCWRDFPGNGQPAQSCAWRWILSPQSPKSWRDRRVTMFHCF